VCQSEDALLVYCISVAIDRSAGSSKGRITGGIYPRHLIEAATSRRRRVGRVSACGGHPSDGYPRSGRVSGLAGDRCWAGGYKREKRPSWRPRGGWVQMWRGGRVAEGAALEMPYMGNRIVGSNPTLSATEEFWWDLNGDCERGVPLSRGDRSEAKARGGWPPRGSASRRDLSATSNAHPLRHRIFSLD
jgi:hypothetical protein